MKQFILPVALLTILWSCDATKQATQETAEVAEKPMPSKGKSRTIDLDYLNTNVRPQDDFFEFSNGTWIKNNPVPPSESRWGSFNELDQANNKKLTALLEEFKSLDTEKGTTQQILGDYYASFMDMDTRNKVGIQAIESELKMVKSLGSKKSLPSLLAKMHTVGISGLFSFGVGQDMMNVEMNITYLSQGGIGLPNKDYYLEESKEEILKKYEAHIAATMQLAGYSSEESKALAQLVVQFETRLAKKMMAPAELRIPEKTYNKMSRSDVTSKAGDFDLEAYLRDIGIESFDSLVVGQPDFVENFNTLIKNVELDEWRAYLLWKTVDHYAGHLDDAFVKRKFRFLRRCLIRKSRNETNQ